MEWGRSKREEIEAALRALFQSHVLSNDDDRFDFVVRESSFTVCRNDSGRQIELDGNGLPSITARYSKVRLVDATLEFVPKPWPEGKGPEDYKLK